LYGIPKTIGRQLNLKNLIIPFAQTELTSERFALSEKLVENLK
jgi:hypothetical protein